MNEEAIEKVIISVSSEVINSHTLERHGLVELKADKKTPSRTSNDGKLIPRYLLPSSGSCHDLCKYGRKHAFEPKVRRPLFSQLSGMGNKAIHEEAQGQANTGFGTLANGRKEKMAIKPKISPQRDKNSGLSIKCTNDAEKLSPVMGAMKVEEGSHAQLSFPNQDQEEVLFEEPVSLELSSPSSSHNGSASFSSSPTKGRKHSYDEDMLSVEELVKEPSSVEVLKFPPVYAAEGSPAERVNMEETVSRDHLVLEMERKQKRSCRTVSTRRKNKAKPTAKSVSEVGKQSSTASYASGKPIIVKNRSSSPPLKPELNKQKSLVSFRKTAPETVRTYNSKSPLPPWKTSIASRFLKLKTHAPRSSQPPNGSPVRRNSGNKRADAADVSMIREKMVLKPAKAYHPSPRTSAVIGVPSAKLWKHEYANKKPTSPLKSVEKKLTSLEPSWRRTEARPSHLTPRRLPTTTSKKENLKSGCAVVSEQDGFSRGEKGERRRANARLEGEFRTPQKLKFRRGKVVDPTSDQADNGGPRRLRFRQSTMAAENRAGKELSRSLRRRKESVGEEGKIAAAAPTVVLRHQDRQEKKDGPGLLNKVIEETANKLVESRKSKVKALVGAFETVISLQERRLAPLV